MLREVGLFILSGNKRGPAFESLVDGVVDTGPVQLDKDAHDHVEVVIVSF